MVRASVLLLALAAAALSACSRERELRCSTDSAYLSARSVEQLRIPEDLSVPDETDALRIPVPAAPGAPDEDEPDRCLEASPAFSENG